MRFHTGERPYKCSFCDKAFITLSHRKSHERSHSAQRVPCPVCGRDFKSDSVLRKHIIIHYPEKFYKCQLCEKTFPTSKQRKGHMKISHPEFKQLVCQYCNKKFDLQSTYDCHMRINHIDLEKNS